MNDNLLKHSSAWMSFSVASFVIASVMMAGGIYFMEASFAAKGFYGMAALMLVQTSINVTKVMRDNAEAQRLHNKIEEARTEKLLMEAAR